jgi:hypothetical protein
MNTRSQMLILVAGFTLTIAFPGAAYTQSPPPLPPKFQDRVPAVPNLATIDIVQDGQPRPLSFQDRWAPAATLAATAERIEALKKPRVVQVETVAPEPDPLMSVLSEPAPRRKAAVASGDICARHGMHKFWYGSTWRCRK